MHDKVAGFKTGPHPRQEIRSSVKVEDMQEEESRQGRRGGAVVGYAVEHAVAEVEAVLVRRWKWQRVKGKGQEVRSRSFWEGRE